MKRTSQAVRRKTLNKETTHLFDGWQVIAEKQFAPGSMLPKVQAAISFVQNSKNPDAKAVITSLDNVENYLNDGTGTIIQK